MRLLRILVCMLLTLALTATYAAEKKKKQPPVKRVQVKLSEDVSKLLLQAGNANSDLERLKLLKQVQQVKDLPDAFRKDLDQMVILVTMWADGYSVNPHSNYLSYLLRMPITKKYCPRYSQGTSLQSMWSYYAGMTRLLGIIQSYGKFFPKPKEEQVKVLRGILKGFQAAHKAFPENEIAALFCGEAMPWPKELEVKADPNAPEWANLQREGLTKLRQVMVWWIEHRQKPEGFFGTGWGDDVEMWRNFTPLTVAFDDPQLAASQALLSNGIFREKHMKKGFTSKMLDVEHAAEDSADTITPMLIFAPNDSIWEKRTLFIFDLAKNLFSGENNRGQLQFKSTFMNVDKIETDPKQATDTFYHVRLMQPVLLLWQWRNNQEVGAFVSRWMKTWATVSMGSENGKPAGVIPTTIHWPDGKPGGMTPEWWAPGNFSTILYNYRESGAISMLPNTMLLCYLMTKDESYIAPLKSMAQNRLDYLQGKLDKDAAPGSLAWTASKSENIIMPALTKYRLATGDTQFDELLAADASGYTKMRLTGDRKALLEELRENAKAFRVNFPIYTSACRAGDRVFVMPQRYFNADRNPLVKPMSHPKIDTLYAMATGDPNKQLYCPINAVRWMTSPVDIAALVTKGDESSFDAELYHFGDSPRKMSAKLLRLAPGKYRAVLRSGNKKGKILLEQKLEVKGPGTELPLTLPAHQLCHLQILPAS